jgi:UDP-glucose 4-epimerase
VLDDLSTGSIFNLDGVAANPGFHYNIDRVQNAELTAELVDRADVVFHLAASVGVRRIIESPVETIENNLQASETVFAAAAKKGKRVLYTSTSEVYGLSTELPFREDGGLLLGAPSKGRWSYACAKAMDEFLALSYHHERGLPVTVVRLFNTVGPRQTGHYGMVIPTLVGQALAGEPLTVFGDGSQTRCFTYVHDVVGCLLDLMNHPASAGQIFNIGSTEEISILDLARKIRALAGSSSEIVTIPYAEAYEEGFEDMPRRVPNIDKIRALTGFHPVTGIDEIVGSVIQSFVEEMSVPTRPAARVA